MRRIRLVTTITADKPLGTRPALQKRVFNSSSENLHLFKCMQEVTTTWVHQSSCWALNKSEKRLGMHSSSFHSSNWCQNASCIGPCSWVFSHQKMDASGLSLKEIELGKLKALKARNCLTYAEYRRAKAALLEHEGMLN